MTDSTVKQKQLKLGLFIRPCGHHIASWRHPDAQADAGVNFPHFIEMAKTAERAKFDMLFSADSLTAFTGAEGALELVHYVAWIEPFSLLTALSQHTTNIGLVCTASTSFDQPFHVARRFAALDIISGGRAGWNVVTSGNPKEAENFSKVPHLPKVERYRKAKEFVRVVKGLWDSWDDDAFLRDKKTGVFFDRSKMHELEHDGEFYHVRGPLNVARSPQGRPVIVEAGLSEDGRQLAAETAEVIFCAHDTMESAQDFYADMKSRALAYGREADDIKIMPGLSVVVAETREAANAKLQQLQELLHPRLGLALLSARIGFDLMHYELDKPLPPLPDNAVISSRSDMIRAWSKAPGASGGEPTLRELCQRFAASRGHYSIIGTPDDVAREMQRWLDNGACDGFNFVPSVFPTGLDDFVNMVIPELQKRGIFRREYEGPTLRDVLGLRRPPNRHAQGAKAAE